MISIKRKLIIYISAIVNIIMYVMLSSIFGTSYLAHPLNLTLVWFNQFYYMVFVDLVLLIIPVLMILLVNTNQIEIALKKFICRTFAILSIVITGLILITINLFYLETGPDEYISLLLPISVGFFLISIGLYVLNYILLRDGKET